MSTLHRTALPSIQPVRKWPGTHGLLCTFSSRWAGRSAHVQPVDVSTAASLTCFPTRNRVCWRVFHCGHSFRTCPTALQHQHLMGFPIRGRAGWRALHCGHSFRTCPTALQLQHLIGRIGCLTSRIDLRWLSGLLESSTRLCGGPTCLSSLFGSACSNSSISSVSCCAQLSHFLISGALNYGNLAAFDIVPEVLMALFRLSITSGSWLPWPRFRRSFIASFRHSIPGRQESPVCSHCSYWNSTFGYDPSMGLSYSEYVRPLVPLHSRSAQRWVETQHAVYLDRGTLWCTDVLRLTTRTPLL